MLFNTFYLWLYSVGHMVKDHSEWKPAAATSWDTLFDFPNRIAYTMAFVTPVVEHWLKQEIA